MIFITIMHQFNVIIHVKRVIGYVVDFSGYAYLKWQGLEGIYKCFPVKDRYSTFMYTTMQT